MPEERIFWLTVATSALPFIYGTLMFWLVIRLYRNSLKALVCTYCNRKCYAMQSDFGDKQPSDQTAFIFCPFCSESLKEPVRQK